MADPLGLELLIYDPLDLDPLPEGYVQDPIPSGKAGVDSDNHIIKISLDDVPTDTGGYLEIQVLTKFIRESVIDQNLADRLAAALQGASDGIAEDYVRDESIITEYEAQLRAMRELDLKTQSNFSLQLTLRTNNFFEFDVGDQVRFIDEAASINILLIIQDIGAELQSTVGLVDQWVFNMTCSPYVINQSLLIAQLVGLSLFPRKRRAVEIGPEEEEEA